MTDSLTQLKDAMIVRGLQSCRLFTGLGIADLGDVAGITTTKGTSKDVSLQRRPTARSNQVEHIRDVKGRNVPSQKGVVTNRGVTKPPIIHRLRDAEHIR